MAHDIFDRHLPLGRRHMCEHRLSGDIADCIDTRRRGFHPFVDKNFSATTGLHRNVFESDSPAVEAPSHRDQQCLDFQIGSVLEMRRDRRWIPINLLDGRSGDDGDVSFFQFTGHDGRDFFIFQGKNAVHQFHHRHVRAEAAIQRGKFTTLDSATDNQETRRNPGEIQQLLARQDLRTIDGKLRKVRPG